ncbi:MAG: hypothetical protein Q8933_11035 [Bacteroidota bacterium]|nr:hypothetical protein [Bacteroidota bacterium]MDP4195571.1 hypothetical protein [Bacteroidota bacterium]
MGSKNFLLTIVFLFVFINTILFPQDKGKQIFVANWNLENLFDTVDDPQKEDEEFLPSSALEWTQERLEKKLSNLAKVIHSMNNGNGPDILSVEEVENQGLLDTLIQKYLSDKNYKIAYADCPDSRGIDVGIIYNADILTFAGQHADTVKLSDNHPTRLILCSAFILPGKDTLYVYANHWPSRRGGENESDQNREAAAQTLRQDIDKLFKMNTNSNILIMGDFNDEPSNESLNKTLDAINFECEALSKNNSDLYNLAFHKHLAKDGSYFYRGNWNMLDNIIVSKHVMEKFYKCESFEVYRPEFMVTRSGKYKDSPFPTYGGKRYLGGYSDHFPVTAILQIAK